MSIPVRHNFHAAPAASGSTRRDDNPASAQHAFDLFLPEPNGVSSTALAATPAIDFPDRQFAPQVARTLDTPMPEAPLPLGGIAPTDREVASARALTVGWAAACGIAAFAFLSQGPSLSPRESQPAAPVVAAANVAKARSPGDITLSADSAGPAAPDAKNARQSSRSPARKTAAPVVPDGHPQSGR